jgi:hypothetical protein
MPEPQLSVRSARARDLAHMLAKRERRTVAQVVELALEAYAKNPASPPIPWREFLDELKSLPRAPGEPDIDIAEEVRRGREPHRGIELE